MVGQSAQAMVRRAQPWLGTIVEISIADALPEPELAQACTLAFGQIAQVHHLMSFHTPRSDLSRINHAPVGSPVEVDPHTWRVLQAALQVSSASAGLFDIRVASRLMDWAMLPLPDQAVAGYTPGQTSFALTPDGKVHKLKPDWLDLGGIAKGYAVDLAIECLQRQGVQSACVNAGGDLRVLGERGFEVRLRDARAPSHMAYQISLKDQALATSASYFSLRQTGQGQRCALVNGQTGEAVLDACSVTVTAPQCMFADALTKVVMASAQAEHSCLAQFGAQAHIT